jgi:hypothetical protein
VLFGNTPAELDRNAVVCSDPVVRRVKEIAWEFRRTLRMTRSSSC